MTLKHLGAALCHLCSHPYHPESSSQNKSGHFEMVEKGKKAEIPHPPNLSEEEQDHLF